MMNAFTDVSNQILGLTRIVAIYVFRIPRIDTTVVFAETRAIEVVFFITVTS